MAKPNNKNNPSKTNAQEVKKQNQKAAQGNYGTEFAEETNAQEVRKQNRKSENKKQ